MIDQLLEFGDVGILRDIPSELTNLTKENTFLKQANTKLKSNNRTLLIILAGLTAYFIYQNYLNPNRETEDYESNDS